MEGYEAFKKLREQLGMTTREFASKAGIALSTLVYYENGKKSLLNLPIKKAIILFDILQCEISQFYLEYYPLESVVEKKVEEWKLAHPREYDYNKLFVRIKNRLMQQKSRARLPDEIYLSLENRFYILFDKLAEETDKQGKISDQAYSELVVPYLHDLGCALEDSLPEEQKYKNEISKRINDKLLYTDYTYKDLATLVDIHECRISSCMTNKGDFMDIRIGTAIKICLVLEETIENIFFNTESVE